MITITYPEGIKIDTKVAQNLFYVADEIIDCDTELGIALYEVAANVFALNYKWREKQ